MKEKTPVPPLSSQPDASTPPEERSLQPRSVHVIINPAAGQESPVLGIMNKIFKEHAIAWEAFVTKDAGDARRYAGESAAGGVDLVMVCGGDGTIMEAASALIGTRTPLAILPCGTANVMALELQIPMDLAQAISLVVGGQNRLRGVDMGMVNGKPFLLRVATGMEAKMVIETPSEAKTRWGTLAYVMKGLSELANPVTSHYTLNLDGLHVEVDGINLMVTNSANVGLPGVTLVQGADVSDGLLDVILVRWSDLPSLIAIATSAVLGREEEPEPILHWQAKEILIESEPQQPAQIDGEELGPGPYHIRVLPRAIQVVCARPAAG